MLAELEFPVSLQKFQLGTGFSRLIEIVKPFSLIFFTGKKLRRSLDAICCIDSAEFLDLDCSTVQIPGTWYTTAVGLRPVGGR